MKTSYVQVGGKLYVKGTEPPSEGHMVMYEIQPYKSMITGEMITSRAQHREHLKMHHATELGNEPLKWLEKPYQGIPDANPQGRREIIRAQFDAMTHREFKAAIKRDVDRVKWNSRN